MTQYTPDAWVIVRFSKAGEVTDKILSGWYGGYLGGDSWRISSGITKIEDDGEFYRITNHSGSVYTCHKRLEKMSGIMASQYDLWVSMVGEQADVDDQDRISVEIVDASECIAKYCS